MRIEVENALNATDDIRPIRSTLGENGYYTLRAANGETRTIAAGHANTVLANAGWPAGGKTAVLWVNAEPLAH